MDQQRGLRMEPSDGELLQRLGEGERDALAPLVERHYRRLYRIILSYVRDSEEALDAVQETFVKVYSHASQWDASRDATAWLTRIAINQALDRYRRIKRRRQSFAPLETDLRVGEERADAEVHAREEADRVSRALGELPEPQRAVFVLRHQHQMSLEEIAGALGLRVGTVKSRLHRAIHQLRHRLGGRP
jgi:RNA polymerase sigma-70 factor (ECF subfamily)